MWLFGNSSFSLYKLFNALEERYQKKTVGNTLIRVLLTYVIMLPTYEYNVVYLWICYLLIRFYYSVTLLVVIALSVFTYRYNVAYLWMCYLLICFYYSVALLLLYQSLLFLDLFDYFILFYYVANSRYITWGLWLVRNTSWVLFILAILEAFQNLFVY